MGHWETGVEPKELFDWELEHIADRAIAGGLRQDRDHIVRSLKAAQLTAEEAYLLLEVEGEDECFDCYFVASDEEAALEVAEIIARGKRREPTVEGLGYPQIDSPLQSIPLHQLTVSYGADVLSGPPAKVSSASLAASRPANGSPNRPPWPPVVRHAPRPMRARNGQATSVSGSLSVRLLKLAGLLLASYLMGLVVFRVAEWYLRST